MNRDMGDIVNKKAIAAAAFLAGSATAGHAAVVTYDFVGSLEGTLGDGSGSFETVERSVDFDFTVTFDNSGDVSRTSDGLEVTLLTLSGGSGIVPYTNRFVEYRFLESLNTIVFEGGGALENNASFDFFFAYKFGANFQNSGTIRDGNFQGTSGLTVTATEVAPIPLPPSVAFLLAGFAGLIGLSRRKRTPGQKVA